MPDTAVITPIIQHGVWEQTPTSAAARNYCTVLCCMRGQADSLLLLQYIDMLTSFDQSFDGLQYKSIIILICFPFGVCCWGLGCEFCVFCRWLEACSSE